MTPSAGFKKGLFRDNPVAVMLVGLCPAAAVTGRVIDALWMSLGLLFVLVLTRLCQTILQAVLATAASPAAQSSPSGEELISFRPRWLGSLLLASCFTASFELILLAFAPDESASLGIYIPLLAVNCIVLERFAASRPGEPARNLGRKIARSLQESGGLGVGFAVSLIVISLVRETLGSGTITLFPMGSFAGTIAVGRVSLAPARALAYAGGAFLCLGYLAGAARLLGRLKARRAEGQGGTEAERS